MAPSKRAAIAEAIDEVITPDSDAAEGLCCTMEAINLALIDWNPGVYATLGSDGLKRGQVAQLIDQVFVPLLGCDEENYTISASTEDLG